MIYLLEEMSINILDWLRYSFLFIQAFQYVAKHGEVCPASWTPGARTMTPGSKDKLNSYWQEVHGKK